MTFTVGVHLERELEKDMNAKLIVQMDGKKTRLLTVKNSKEQNDGSREKYKDFTFDHSYWSFDHGDSHYASQEQVFSDLGVDVIDSAFEGYNACVFAYGQTGSGKTFTMMGSPECQGLIPRICRQLFSRMAAGKETGSSYRTEVSYLEIYNERVKDLLSGDAGHSLRVREHPKLGPYVQDLSRHLVSDYDDIQECMTRGNQQRTTASTQMNDVSSRSHAIFTLTFVRAGYTRHNNMPCETLSKVHLVDLAGSERADATGATGQRLVEGAHINKSLVTLGSVISALAESSQQADNRTPKTKKNVFIPYRDSVLTWLLKDSLGGNSKTIMIAAISPADCNYGETLSTLRYANRAKNIINKPTINEDPNVKLIRELRDEIDKLRAQIAHNTNPVEAENAVLATLQRKEAQEKVLTEKWTEKWRETQQILQEQKALGLRKSGLGVVLDSDMPHLVGIDDNLLSTGVTLYHLKEGETVIGSEELSPTPDIVLSGAGVLPLHCRVVLREGVATLLPAPGAQCWLNTVLLDGPAKLSQGCILLLGRTNMFRYNDPAEAAKLRLEGSASVMNLSRLSLLSWSTTDLAASTENLNTTLSDLESEIKCERIEAQRAELERERQQFLLQQQERQRRWHEEREQLLMAQKKLDEIEKEEVQISNLQDKLGDKRKELESFVETSVKELLGKGYELNKKKELEELEQELQSRVATVASHRVKVERLQAELAALGAQRRGLQRALRGARPASADPEHDSDTPPATPTGVKRSKSELVLRHARNNSLDTSDTLDSVDPLSAAERELFQNKKLSLSLSLDPLPSPNSALPTDETFHTATSTPKAFPGDSAPGSPAHAVEPPRPRFRLGPAPPDDSDDMSSTEDYCKPRIVEGQSSSSVERSPEERHQRIKYRKRITGDKGRRQVTEAEALRAMQRLCSRIASQKLLVISSLENDCSKEELNRQIAVLQELQKKYVRLEMALQYSFFDNQASRRPIMVTPIQETPSLTLSESDMQVATDQTNDAEQTFEDPLLNRLKETEAEASDNVSTSNDELPCEGAWRDPLAADPRAPALPVPVPVPLNDDTTALGLTHPINFAEVVSIPGWVVRGAGAGTHHEYEVRVWLGPHCHWQLLRRYRRFRDLYLAMRRLYGHKVAAIPFPARALWSSEALARARRPQLEAFLRRLLAACAQDARCPLHAAPLTRDSLVAFSPFFRKKCCVGRVRERQVRHGMMPAGARHGAGAGAVRGATGAAGGGRGAAAGALSRPAAAAALPLRAQPQTSAPQENSVNFERN
ncbi:Kinesin-like protein KIF16B [Papilio xuthus]|uniref:Kinesin-like protein KIF16B n=1 Tax=Papilio xuthus TaxID=66420 RepID=A0A194PFN7_PAPXU|nr:Kinesin-like protein KIF16B [Papilio xuthus]